MRKLAVVMLAMAFLATISTLVFGSEFKASGDLELFYENSDEVVGNEDSDQFITNQLYLTIDGLFDGGLSARLKLDGADIVSSDGGEVTESIVEEANFTIENIGGSPVTLVFGKDEMPYGLDYDKYLNDPIVHAFEIDKVWGFHGIVKLTNIGNVAAGLYQHRNGSGENQIGDNVSVRLMADKLLESLSFEVSYAREEYIDAAGVAEDQTKYSLGMVFKFMEGANFNLEYNAIQNLKGVTDYDPALLSVGLEGRVGSNLRLYGRYEKIIEDTASDVEENFFALGVSYIPTKNYTISLEYSNFSSANLKDAADLMVADGALENSIKLGIRAKF